ncbi:MAG TPA: FprA family A-type flavoprotein [Bacillota bacterium]|nr:FprA family A-type flavoprotein [Bacillota bacterium]
MKTQQLAENVWWIGALDPDLRIFDIIMRAEQGTSYNSYLIKGKDKTAIIETVKSGFMPEFLDKIQSLTDPARIDYIILNHMEPDHSGSIAELLKIAPHAQVVVSKTGEHFIKNILNYEPNLLKMGDGDCLDLGGKTLQFIAAPFLHWPDSMFTYLVEDAILFDCDFLGAHYADPMLFGDLDPNSRFFNDFKYYFDHIMRPFKRYVLQALDKLSKYPLKMVAPGHGPVIRQDIQKYLDCYRQWSEANPEQDRVIIAYVTAYGNTAKLAEKIAAGINATGVITELYDLVETNPATLVDKIEGSKGLCLGSPTINGDAVKPVHDLLSSLATLNLKGKLGAAFGSYGWSGEAVPILESRMAGIKFKVINSTVKPILIPTEADFANAFEFGKAFGEAVRAKR